MRAVGATCGALGLGCCLAGLLLLGREAGRPVIDPTPLGPAALALQGPLAAGRALVIPFSFLEMADLVATGRHEEAEDAVLRLLTLAPWLQEIWILHGWNLAYQVALPRPTPLERAAGIATAQRWFALAAKVLPRDAEIPAAAGFVLAHLLPDRSPEAQAWEKIQGIPPQVAADRWFKEALRRAPDWSPLLARRSAIALRLGGRAFARGDRSACRAYLTAVVRFEETLLRRGSTTSQAWLESTRRLMSWTDRPFPWPPEVLKRMAATAAGRIFLAAAGGNAPK